MAGRRSLAITACVSTLVVFVIVDHDAQNVECILSFVEKREEVLLRLECVRRTMDEPYLVNCKCFIIIYYAHLDRIRKV